MAENGDSLRYPQQVRELSPWRASALRLSPRQDSAAKSSSAPAPCRQKLLGPIPEGDILLHCGDFSMSGKPRSLREFNRWMGQQTHKCVV